MINVMIKKARRFGSNGLSKKNQKQKIFILFLISPGIFYNSYLQYVVWLI